jgi:hypothetical protein
VTARQGDLFEEPAPKGLSRLRTFAECAAAVDRLFQDALASQGPTAFTEFIEFARRLSNLSVYNAMLVRLQRPGALAVATEKKWGTAERWVKPGAIPIIILRPFGPVAFLDEVSDTDGWPLPGEHANPFAAHVVLDEIEWAKIIKLHREKHGVRIEERNFGSILAGNARNLQAVPVVLPGAAHAEWLVQLNANHDIPTRFATLAHELGHIFCGHCGPHRGGNWPDRHELTHAVRETEAEAVSYLVCSRRDLKVAAKDYLSELIADVGLRQVSLYAVFEAANRVEGKAH